MRKFGSILIAALAISCTPAAARPKSCDFGSTILALAHIQARVLNHEGGDAQVLLREAKDAVSASACPSV